MSQFTSELAGAFLRRDDLDCFLALSRFNENPGSYSGFDGKTHIVNTFRSAAGALWVPRLVKERRRLREFIKQRGITDILCLMPHVWSGDLTSFAKSMGIRKLTIVHDARPHPGDITAVAHFLLRRDLRQASQLVTLSQTVTDQLVQQGIASKPDIIQLFHPLVGGTRSASRARPVGDDRWRVLFLGRIMAYKGLPLFVGAMEELVRRGFPVAPAVMGEGDMSAYAARLNAIGAIVTNRWLSDGEIADALNQHHILMVSNIEASQSGVLAAAHSAGLPVVAAAVGGIVEQIEPDESGVLAEAVTAVALADAAQRLMVQPGLYESILANLEQLSSGKSVERFAGEISSHLDASR